MYQKGPDYGEILSERIAKPSLSGSHSGGKVVPVSAPYHIKLQNIFW
jgi:hypothetical protein